MRPSNLRRLRALAAVALLGVAGCGAEQALRNALTPEPTPHERYTRRLRDAGLDSTALGLGWITAAQRAIREPVVTPLPFRETGYLSAAEPRAIGYRVPLRRGQKLTVRLEVADSAGMQLFLDLYQQPTDSTEEPDHVASADPRVRALDYEARRDGDYLLRLQPELLRGGQYTLTLESGPSLAFPVAGRDSRAAQSFFGAARDGGARSHHGIDIFAPRGTPVIAVAEGIVRVSNSNLGGKVVWLNDLKRNQRLYYAHLDTQIVHNGALVKVGDTLGLVGNTGNARTTPPHLHFGIYSRGPKDPLPYVREPRERPADVTAPLAALGERRRTEARVALRARPDADEGETLAAGTPLRVIGAAGASYRVLLPDGRAGWVRARSTEPLGDPLGSTRLLAGAALRDRPASVAATIETVMAPRSVAVLARFGDYALVRGGGRTGWVQTGATD